jgi:hypothetical protein
VARVRTARADNRQVARFVITGPPVAVMQLPVTLGHTDRPPAVFAAASTPAKRGLALLADGPCPYPQGAEGCLVGIDVGLVLSAGEEQLAAIAAQLLDRRASRLA